MTYAPPSRNSSDDGTLVGALKIVLTKFLQGVDDMLPAKVIAYDAATNLASVQPLIAVVSTANERIPRAVVAAIPVAQFGAGGFVMRFPVTPGDLGWIKANDRDISLFKRAHTVTSPNTQRKHSFEDALFIPETMLQGVTIDPLDADNAVWQSFDGTVRIALGPNYIKMITTGVGIGGVPSVNSILDLQSTTKAFKPPRMTTAQRNAISAEEGMVIWNLDVHGLQSYNGSVWG